MSIHIYEDWLLIDSDMLQCGTSRTYTHSTKTGISQTEESDLSAKVGGALGKKGLGELSSEISARTGVSVTLEKETTVARSWTFTAPPKGELDFAIYQKIMEIRFDYGAGGLKNDQWTLTVINEQPEFRSPTNLTPKVHPEAMIDRTPWMDFFVSATFNYMVPAIYENGTSINRAETLTIVHPANLTREGLIQPIDWKTQYAHFGDSVLAPSHLPSYYAGFMLNATSTGVLEHSWGAPHVQPSLPLRLKVTTHSDTGVQPLVLVTDYYDNPIGDATVEFDSFSSATDAYGLAYFPQVNISDVKLVNIVATKSGYISGSLKTLMHPRMGQKLMEPGDGGGVLTPTDNLGLLAPYIGLTSTILVATVATAICIKRVKRRKEKQ